MREILFRGKRTDNGEWVYGDLLHDWSRGNTKPDIVICNNMGKFRVDQKTVGWDTSLRDKFGKKIFIGDVVKQDFALNNQERSIVSVIEYGIESPFPKICGVLQRFRDGSGTSPIDAESNGIVFCEIIGNIHDKPALLRQV